jgi:hypothetical protein
MKYQKSKVISVIAGAVVLGASLIACSGVGASVGGVSEKIKEATLPDCDARLDHINALYMRITKLQIEKHDIEEDMEIGGMFIFVNPQVQNDYIRGTRRIRDIDREVEELQDQRRLAHAEIDWEKPCRLKPGSVPARLGPRR